MPHQTQRRKLLKWTAPFVSVVVLPAHALTSTESVEQPEEETDDSNSVSPEEIIEIIRPILFKEPR